MTVLDIEKDQGTVGWQGLPGNIRWRIEPFIDGRYRPSMTTRMVEDINPATESVLTQFSAGDARDVDEAVRVARRAFDDGRWSEQSPSARAAVLLKLADLIIRHKAELALFDTLEMGKPIRAAITDAEFFAPSVLRSCAGFADKLHGESAQVTGAALRLNVYEPRGVVGAITPWNFPIVNAVIKIAPALAAGNTVVLKPSELSPASALKLAELALEAGLPAGVLNVVPGLGPTVGEALALHPDVDMLSFTGSTLTGRKLMELSGRSNAKPLLLECGGKSPQVVFADVDDLESVADAAVHSALWNQGQVCSAHTRLIVHESIEEMLVDRVVRRASEHRPANPLDERTTFGPLASPAQRDRVKRYVDAGLEAGAEVALKGTIQVSGGCYVSPTIFRHVEPHMSIAREEIFGPILCVQTFGTEAEALSLANGTDYGLAATVWTRDSARGRRMAHAIKAGHVAVRTSGKEGPPADAHLSGEPRKASGFGCELGLKGLQAYSTLKSVSFTGA